MTNLLGASEIVQAIQDREVAAYQNGLREGKAELIEELRQTEQVLHAAEERADQNAHAHGLLEFENGRLKADLDATYDANDGLSKVIDDLKARLSAAEEELKKSVAQSFAHRADAEIAEDKLKRAEAVVEAAKRWRERSNAANDQALLEALRRYEEGK